MEMRVGGYGSRGLSDRMVLRCEYLLEIIIWTFFCYLSAWG